LSREGRDSRQAGAVTRVLTAFPGSDYPHLMTSQTAIDRVIRLIKMIT
jgi:hypothetical protein